MPTTGLQWTETMFRYLEFAAIGSVPWLRGELTVLMNESEWNEMKHTKPEVERERVRERDGACHESCNNKYMYIVCLYAANQWTTKLHIIRIKIRGAVVQQQHKFNRCYYDSDDVRYKNRLTDWHTIVHCWSVSSMWMR